MKTIAVSILLILVLSGTAAMGQSEYSIFRDSSIISEKNTSHLSLELENLNYLRNYEYFNRMTLSYTLFGYQFAPQLKYQANKFLTIKGGIFLRHEFGRKGFVEIEPMFTLKLQKNGYAFLLGNIEGALNHRFVEPIQNFESFISNRTEQGVQVLADKKHLWFDFHIDWEKAIVNNSPTREEFTTGISARIKALHGSTRLEFPLQVVSMHKGGQMDTSGLPGETLLNMAAGISLSRQLNAGWLKNIRTEHYFAFYRDASHDKRQPFPEGRGYYSSLSFLTEYVDLDIRYWKGNGYIGPRGGPLFNSVSNKEPGYTEKHRELVLIALIHDRQLAKNIFLDLRFEPYYDCRAGKLEYAYGMMFRFHPEFFLTKLKEQE